jgi:hypothetical protein
MNATKPLAVLFAVLLVGAGAAAAAGSSYRTGTDAYAMDATLVDGTVTVTVDHGDSGVANATVYANDERVGTTDANGTVSFELGDDDLDVTVEADGVEMKGEYAVQDGSLVLEKSEFEREDDDADDRDDDADDRDENRDGHAADGEQHRNQQAEQNRQSEQHRQTERSDANAQAMNGDERPTASAERGPPAELPEQASDRASSVHGVIDDFLSGDVANLGRTLGGLFGGGDAANGQGH